MRLLNSRSVTSGLPLFLLEGLLDLLQRLLAQAFLGLDRTQALVGLLGEQHDQLVADQGLVMLDLGRRVLVGHLQGDVGLVVLQARPAAVVADQRRVRST